MEMMDGFLVKEGKNTGDEMEENRNEWKWMEAGRRE